jgi:hypothetical protein
VPVHRKVTVRVLANAMKAFATFAKWIDVYGQAPEMGRMVKQLMADFLGDRVPLGH